MSGLEKQAKTMDTLVNMEVYDSVKRWLNKLEAKSRSVDFNLSSTKRAALYWLKVYCRFLKNNPDSLIADRTHTLQNQSQTTQRKHEEFIDNFIIELRRKDKSPNTISTAVGLIRSYYKANYVELKEVTRVSVYKVRPFKVPSVEDLKKMCKIAEAPLKAWICCQKDCLHPSSYIQLANGELTTINDIKEGDAVLSANSIEPSVALVESIYQKKPENVFDIRTAHGQIQASPNHTFLAYKNHNLLWKKAKELDTKDYLVRLKKLPEMGEPQQIPKLRKNKPGKQCGVILPQTLTEKFAQILGYFSGDGCLDSHKNPRELQFTDKDYDTLFIYSKLLSELFPTHKPSIRKRERQRLHFRCGLLAEYFIKYLPEIVERSRQRSIPAIIQRSPSSIVAHFLRGLFDAEAYVGKRIEFVTTSKKFAHQIPLLLLRFGILSKLEEGKTRTRKLGTKIIIGGKSRYKIVIEGINTPLFREKIGFSHPKKNKKLSKITIDKDRAEKNTVLPLGRFLLEKAVCESKMGLYRLLSQNPQEKKHHFRKGTYSSFKLTPKKVLCLLEKLNSKGESYKQIRSCVDSGIIAEKITTIKKISNKLSLYDLHIPTTAKYYANGFLVHNSGLANIDLLSLSRNTLSSEFGTIKTQLKKGTVPIHVEIRRQKTGERTDSFFGPNAIEALNNYLNYRSKDPRLFTMSARTIQKQIKTVAIQAKVATEDVPITPYSLRKFFNVTMKYMAKVPESVVERWMGHSIGRVRSAYSVVGKSDVAVGMPISKMAETYMQAYQYIDINNA